MKILTVGHKYELDNMEGGTQTVQFIHKVPAHHEECLSTTAPEAGVCDCKPRFVTLFNGTTNEEVLSVLIDRLTVMNAKLPCRENSTAITHLETALLWLGKRTADRKTRGVEGTPAK